MWVIVLRDGREVTRDNQHSAEVLAIYHSAAHSLIAAVNIEQQRITFEPIVTQALPH